MNRRWQEGHRIFTCAASGLQSFSAKIHAGFVCCFWCSYNTASQTVDAAAQKAQQTKDQAANKVSMTLRLHSAHALWHRVAFRPDCCCALAALRITTLTCRVHAPFHQRLYESLIMLVALRCVVTLRHTTAGAGRVRLCKGRRL